MLSRKRPDLTGTRGDLMRLVLPAAAVAFVIFFSTSISRAADLRYFDDATLHAVHFVDSMVGWAVGDEGVIWNTIDGGKTWERKPTGTRASLRSVQFLNPFLGWVVGREELAGGGSVGVLLFTRDGGENWQRLLTNAMPGLNQVRFSDPKLGFVFGDGSDQFPTGVFKTTDGGRTWEPVKGPRSPSWLAGEFLGPNKGILAGAWSRLATFRDGTFASAEVDSLGGRSLRGLQILEKRALAVGQGGLVLTSISHGARWGFADLKLPADVLASLDFHSIHSAKGKVWVVGRPGSVVLHSADQGITWSLQRTGQALPLNGVFFFDERRGCAVGEGGVILGTDDCGKTWSVQRRGGERAALLFVHARAGELPLECLARLGAEEGYLATGLLVTSPDPNRELKEQLRRAREEGKIDQAEFERQTESLAAAGGQATQGLRFAAAVRRAGGTTAEMLWHFPLPAHLAQADKQALVKFWDEAHGGGSARELLRQLVLALRTWRPSVVITDHPDPKAGDQAAGALVTEAMHEAFKLAADPKAFPEQIEHLGLEPWSVSKVYAVWDRATDAQVVIDGNEPRARLEASPRDFAAAAASLLAESTASLPGQRLFRLLDSRVKGAASQSHLMDGIALEPGKGARRTLASEHKENPDIKVAFRERRALETLAAKVDEPAKTLAQIGPVLAKLPDEQGAPAISAIAGQYARQGQWELAREAYLLMVDRYPAHALAVDAYRWLVRHASSSEARRRHELGQFLMVTQTKFPLAARGPLAKPLVTEDEESSVEGKQDAPSKRGVERTGQITFLADQAQTRQWYRGSLEIGKRLAGFGPLFGSDPAIQFCLQASRRHLGEFKETEDWYRRFKDHFPKGPWHDAAVAELWLAGRSPACPKAVFRCPRAEAKPFVDGKLDDPCWKHKSVVLGNAVGDSAKENPTEAWFAFDADYLYLALRCKHPAGKQVAPVKGRKHDADLRNYDRVSLLLDLDRDYSTCFHLQVDQRGCVRDDCWGDLTWNPRWFVAVHSEADVWQIEAAIPMGELSADRVRAGTAWACNVVRTLPGRGVQAGSLPADVEPHPEGMGLLVFFLEQNRSDSRTRPLSP
jgi:photosystem II stability/assembly factor-like uncharacterized protein